MPKDQLLSEISHWESVAEEAKRSALSSSEATVAILVSAGASLSALHILRPEYVTEGLLVLMAVIAITCVFTTIRITTIYRAVIRLFYLENELGWCPVYTDEALPAIAFKRLANFSARFLGAPKGWRNWEAPYNHDGKVIADPLDYSNEWIIVGFVVILVYSTLEAGIAVALAVSLSIGVLPSIGLAVLAAVVWMVCLRTLMIFELKLARATLRGAKIRIMGVQDSKRYLP